MEKTDPIKMVNLNQRHFRETVSPIYNWLKVVLLDRPWLIHQAPAINNIFNCPFK